MLGLHREKLTVTRDRCDARSHRQQRAARSSERVPGRLPSRCAVGARRAVPFGYRRRSGGPATSESSSSTPRLSVSCFPPRRQASRPRPAPSAGGCSTRWTGCSGSRSCWRVVVLDLAIYGQHVLFHAVPGLWRLHMVHHADLDFDVTTGVRFHPFEVLLSMVVKMTVVGALGAAPLAVILFEMLLSATSGLQSRQRRRAADARQSTAPGHGHPGHAPGSSLGGRARQGNRI